MIRAVFSLGLLGLSCAFGYLYYVQYFRWRSCFNELGRCYDAEAGVVYLEQSGAIWSLLTVLAFGAFLYQVRKRPKAKR